ncbi:putative tRNA-splicing endonuclease subunit tsp-1 [Ceratocystis fimbriata CBS 114723]|uniref:Putative tRNA-splicing endonuclease subunit tsp-1 n=1 Tax=Ceratocystis fimbriata CBS 114723 TaxID=1035309 RepID=A0A2C5WYH2_9PEZI|nr:putative tRNA-splicing endonuclease subunit tsp-1 [Ceratocystis fimbriata CBS 114723]
MSINSFTTSSIMQTSSPSPGHVTSASPSTQDLVNLVLHNLQNQHEWTGVKTHRLDHSSVNKCDDRLASQYKGSLPRPLISGLPPRRMYIHPDEQIAALEIEKQTGTRPTLGPEFEWVLPVHISEQWAIKDFTSMFAVIDALGDTGARKNWVRTFKQKRLMLAIVHNDSTVVYYFVHDGSVKPRQN